MIHVSKEVIKKTEKHSFFRTVTTGSNRYNWESLEIPNYDVLQIMKLSERHVVIEYGKYEEDPK